MDSRSYGQSSPQTVEDEFEVRQSLPHRLVVVGLSPQAVSALDQQVSLALNETNGLEGLEQVLHAVGASIGHRVGLGFVTAGPLLSCTLTRAYSNVAARVALVDILETCHQNIVYQLLFDATSDAYLFNLDGVVVTKTDQNGRRWLKPVMAKPQ
jgi:hypothetical protein